MTKDINRIFALQCIKSNPHMVAIFNEMLEGLEVAEESLSNSVRAGEGGIARQVNLDHVREIIQNFRGGQ